MIGSSGQSVTYNVTGYKWRTSGAEMPAVSVPERWITRRLRVKLRGRTEAPDQHRGAQSLAAHAALDLLGPLQLLGGMLPLSKPLPPPETRGLATRADARIRGSDVKRSLIGMRCLHFRTIQH